VPELIDEHGHALGELGVGGLLSSLAPDPAAGANEETCTRENW